MASVQFPSGDPGLANAGASAVTVAPRCHILKLPTELLVEVLSAAALWPEEIDGTEFTALYAAPRALTLVCRHFNHIATPILYSRLALTLWGIVGQKWDQDYDVWGNASDAAKEVIHQNFPGKRGLRLLHRTMAANHGLRSLCRDLVFDLNDDLWDRDDCEFQQCGRDLIKWCTGTESLRLYDGLGNRGNRVTAMSLLVLASASMPRLKRLALTGRRQSFDIDRLFDADMHASIIRFPNLRELQLVGLTEPHHDDPSLWDKFESARGKAPFTELLIQYYDARPSLLPMILMWPARLTKFTCLGRSGDWLEEGEFLLDLGTVWSGLGPQRLSLESIRIDSVCDPLPYSKREAMLGAADFTQFECLKFLSLSYWATGNGAGDSESGTHDREVALEAALLAPCLETFEWTFDARDERPLFLNDFQQREEDFLRRLATAVAKQGVPLRKISIVCTPLPGVGVWEDVDNEGSVDADSVTAAVVDLDFEYPWDRMDRLADEFRCLGIDLTYNEPSVSRAVSDEVLRKARETEDVYQTYFGDLFIWNVGEPTPSMDEI